VDGWVPDPPVRGRDRDPPLAPPLGPATGPATSMGIKSGGLVSLESFWPGKE